MLKGAILDQSALRDVSVVSCKAHGETEIDLWVGVKFLGAKLDNVS